MYQTINYDIIPSVPRPERLLAYSKRRRTVDSPTQWQHEQQRRKQFMDRSTSDSLSSWLLSGVETGKFDGIELFEEPSDNIQIDSMFKSLDDKNQRKMREAVALAVHASNPEYHDSETIQELAFVAADTRSIAAAPRLIQVIDENLITHPNEDEGKQIQGSVVAVIAGFHNEKVALEALERWFWSDDFDNVLKGVVGTGIVAEKKDEYPRYMSHILKISKQDPRITRYINFWLHAWINEITLPTFTTHLHELQETEIETILRNIINRFRNLWQLTLKA